MKKKFINRCKQLGVLYKDDGYIMSIDAPKRKKFASYGNTYEVIHYDYDGWTKAEAYKRFIEIMAMGLTN